MTAPAGNDIVIIDETEACPYLEGETARMPLRMPIGKITHEQADVCVLPRGIVELASSFIKLSARRAVRANRFVWIVSSLSSARINDVC